MLYLFHLIYSILSKHMFIAVDELAPHKKLKPDNSSSIFPTLGKPLQKN